MNTILWLCLASVLASWLMLRRRARRAKPVESQPLLVDDAPTPDQVARFQGTGTFVWALPPAAPKR
ncbi:MAG TPA: hypothetical protein VFO79_11415 [Xanthomonadales bacterium]|nr:hypothetical protein [Xanthomonadales bacterium]